MLLFRVDWFQKYTIVSPFRKKEDATATAAAAAAVSRVEEKYYRGLSWDLSFTAAS